MKRFLAAGVVMILVMAAAASAQQGPGRKGMWGSGQQMYDPSKAETIAGKVTAVDEFTSRRGVNTGMHLSLDADGKKIIVHLGPKTYLEQQPVKIAAGDNLELKGVRTTRRGQEVFVAAEVKKGGEVLKLRDETGRPLWAGTGAGAGPAAQQKLKAPVGR